MRGAMDIGASPGGWTEYLMEHINQGKGSRVVAVDPGDLEDRLLVGAGHLAEGSNTNANTKDDDENENENDGGNDVELSGGNGGNGGGAARTLTGDRALNTIDAIGAIGAIGGGSRSGCSATAERHRKVGGQKGGGGSGVSDGGGGEEGGCALACACDTHSEKGGGRY